MTTETIYDEASVPDYILPDPLLAEDGAAIQHASSWHAQRRSQILGLFETEMFGKTPRRPVGVRVADLDVERHALHGVATCKQFNVVCNGNGQTTTIDLLLYLPNRVSAAAPVFLGFNFGGNHTIHADPGITLSHGGCSDKAELASSTTAPRKVARRTSASRWPVERSSPAATAWRHVYYGDIDPDFDDGFQNGVHPLFYPPGQTQPAGTSGVRSLRGPGALSRAMDLLRTATVDRRHVAVWATRDWARPRCGPAPRIERFALVISNNSGCGGAALSRRRFGETVARINTSFPHWFCGNFKQYNDHEAALPVDQHMLIALIAPRPVYVASAAEDRWADPRGEFLAAKDADPVYRLLGTEGLPADEMPSGPSRPRPPSATISAAASTT